MSLRAFLCNDSNPSATVRRVISVSMMSIVIHSRVANRTTVTSKTTISADGRTFNKRMNSIGKSPMARLQAISSVVSSATLSNRMELIDALQGPSSIIRSAHTTVPMPTPIRVNRERSTIPLFSSRNRWRLPIQMECVSNSSITCTNLRFEASDRQMYMFRSFGLGTVLELEL